MSRLHDYSMAVHGLRQRDGAVTEHDGRHCVYSWGDFKICGVAQRRESVLLLLLLLLLLSVISHWSAGGTSYWQSNLSTWTFTLIVINIDDDNRPAWLYAIYDTSTTCHSDQQHSMEYFQGFVLQKVVIPYSFHWGIPTLAPVLAIYLSYECVVCDIGPLLSS